MENTPKKIYLYCLELIEKSDYASFAENFSNLIEISNDENFESNLKINLNRKLQNDCKDVKLEAIALKEFISVNINWLYEKYRILKIAFESCNQYLAQVDLLKVDSNNGKRLIENEISKIVKNNFLTYIKNKTNESVFDTNLKNTLNFLISYNITEEISDQILSILNELEIDNDEDLHKRMTDSMLNKGLKGLKEYENDIPPKDFKLLESNIIGLFKNEQDYTEQTPNEIILEVLKELKIKDKDGLHNNIINSILSKGVDSLSDFKECISKNNLNTLQERLKLLSTLISKKNVEERNDENKIVEILNEVKIKDKDDLYKKIIDCVLKSGTKDLHKFENDVAKNKLSTLETKLNEIFKSDLNNNNNYNNSTEENEIILEILTEVKVKNKDFLYDKIIKSLKDNGLNGLREYECDIPKNKYDLLEEKLKNHFVAENNEEKVDLMILNILKECKIEDDDNLHKKIIDEIMKNESVESIEKFKDDLTKKEYDTLENKLNSNKELYKLFSKKKPKLDLKTEILLSGSKFNLKNKINFNKFNSVEGYVKSVDEILNEICQNTENNGDTFAKSIFTLMIYLIKRQQSLKFFIKELNFRLEEKQQNLISLKELIFNLLLNSEDDVRIKIFQLLHSTNPVPFVDYMISDENSLELRFYPEVYWLNEVLNKKKILSFSLDSNCKGKTRLINSIFCTHFEETFKDSPFFNGTIDLEIMKSFGSQENNYFVADTHGIMHMNILNKLVDIFEVFIIHIHEDTLRADKNKMKEIKEFLDKINKKAIILVRDSKMVRLRSKCTDQDENIKIYGANFQIKFDKNIKICSVPELNDNEIVVDYGRTLRDFIYEEINNEKVYSSFKDDNNEKILEVYHEKYKKNIYKINNVVEPFLTQLKYAIKNNGINQENLFALYPLYFELNLKKYEINKLDSFSNSNEKLNNLKIESAKLKIELDKLMESYSKESKICIIYDMFNKLLNSNDFVLMINFLSKKLNQTLQIELKERQKEKEELINKLRFKQDEKNTNDTHSIECEINNLNLLIDKKRISIEIIWREMILIYNCLKSFKINREDFLIIGDKFSDLIFSGQPFEILDGDNFIFNNNFLQDIFKSKQHKIRVISILGPQNSGKSTLLNFMFGCDFTVSDGRCTRGIYGSLIKSNNDDFDYYLILDTEGLQSIEKGDKEYDRKLILFCFAVSNILIINTKDQITDDVKTTLEICVDSLSKIDVVRVQKPSVYFVMNQKADPNRKTDQDAINKIISNFTSNGLISQLKLEGNNFETLPSAFNSSILKFNNGKSSVRSFTTSIDFTDRVLQFTNNIIRQIKQLNNDEAFSNIFKWVDFSNIIFDTINMYPDLTLYKDIAEKAQENKLQSYLNDKIRNKLSNKVRDSLFNEMEKLQRYEDAENHLKNKFCIIKQELINDFESYLKQNSVSEIIRKLKKDHLISQINQTEDSWIQLLKIKKREKDLRRTINSGEGIINERVNFLLKSGYYYSKEEAEKEFEILFQERLDEMHKNIDESINKTDSYFNLIYTIYSSLEKFALPNKNQLEKNLKDLKCEFQSPISRSDGKHKNSINLKQIINELKVIDKDQFESFYEACCFNMLTAIDFIEKNDRLALNELKLHLKKQYLLDWEPLVYQRNYEKYYEIRLIDFNMIDVPKQDIDNNVQFNNESVFHKLKLFWREKKQKILQMLRNQSSVNHSRNFYSEEEFSFVIRNFLCSKAIANHKWYLIFDQTKYLKKLNEISESIDLNQELDHELVQSIILKLDNLFEDYNKDLNSFDLALTIEPKRYAHMVVFKKLVHLYSNKNIEKANYELSLWQQKRGSLLKFFVSQLSPDQDKDQENAKQCLRLFSEIIEIYLIEECKLFISSKLEENEKQYSRLKMQEKHDSTLSVLTKDQIYSFVLDPTNFLLNDFKIQWTSFEENINQEIINIQSNFAKNFKGLKECFKQINEHLSENKQSAETFRANNIFTFINEDENVFVNSSANLSRSSSCEINNTGYLKGLCASILLFDLIIQNKTQSTYLIENETFQLENNLKEKFSEIKPNINDDLKDYLISISSHLSIISIDFIDLFVKSMIDLIDKSHIDFLAKKYTFENLGFNKDKYMSRIKGCETSCPCCGRLCDAEHYKVQTEIGSETNKHKCNRGHQFRGFNGFKLEHSNSPSFKMCEAMKDNDHIRYNGKTYQWTEYKSLYPKWDFDSTGSTSDWVNKCTYIWSIIGNELCDKFGMKFSSVAVDLGPSKSYDPIHFILVLDDSGSMRSKGKWDELIKSVSNFFDIRSKEGSTNDLVSVIYFSVDASIVLANSVIYPNLVNELLPPSFGGNTNFSAALKRVIQIIQQNQSKSQKFGIVFMSDGQASYPKEEIELIKLNYLNSIYKFWTIGYGKTENFDILKNMLRELFGNDNNFKNPTEPIELLNIYVEIAREDNKS